MAKIQQTLSKASSGNAGYFWITLLAGVLILLGVHDFFHSYDPNRDEALSLFSTIFFLCGVYAGRYIALLWTDKGKNISNSLLIRLGITVLVAGILLVVAAQFMLAVGKPVLGLLLIGLPALVLSISLGMLIKMMRSSIRGQLQDARSSAEQSQSELKLLQSQLSPHFLFNTLNNIYGISLSQHEKVPTLLLKLSALLRYSVYDAKEEYVPLRDEMEYINNYIEFEKIRIGEKLILQTSFDIKYNPEAKIAPLLLIVFMENAFKHAKNTTEQKIFIDVVLKTWGNSILFSVRNSSDSVKHESSILNRHSGFGLENVVRRLDLLYGNAYDLKIDNSDGLYTVMLQVKAK